MNSNREMAIRFSPKMEMETSSCGFVMLDGAGDNVEIREKVLYSLRLEEKDGGGVQERFGVRSNEHLSCFILALSLPSTFKGVF